MRCPSCDSAYSRVYKTLKVTKNRTRRYRTCQHCGKNFSTTEEVNPPKELKPEEIYLIDDDLDLDP